MDPDSYRTISSLAQGTYKEKGSKFLSFAYPVKTEEEIKTILATIRKEHFSARHCCYAWSLGVDGLRFRQNDDGEPSGTAGRPIYGQIRSLQLTNILVVVVRYFGGTLLGVSGLIQAYKQATQDALENATITTENVTSLIDISFNYQAMNGIMLIQKEENLEIVNSAFEIDCRMTLRTRVSKLVSVLAKIEKCEGVTAVSTYH